MDIPLQSDLFSPTVENRFVFSLFDLLLCGVILLVIVRGWRAASEPHRGPHSPLSLLMAFACLAASFALTAAHAGAWLFLNVRPPRTVIDVLTHALQVAAWLLLLAGARRPLPGDRGTRTAALLIAVAVLLMAGATQRSAPSLVATTFDLLDIALVGLALVVFHHRPLGARALTTATLAILFAAALLHFIGDRVSNDRLVWNLEQLAWPLALLTFALAIGEANHDLFDRVFVRLHIAFIVLAGAMTLAIIKSETNDYLSGLRGRADGLAQFLHAHVVYFGKHGEAFDTLLRRDDLLQRLALGFGDLPELKIVRIAASGRAIAFEIDGAGSIRPRAAGDGVPLEPDETFLITALALEDGSRGEVALYGTRDFLHRHVRGRVVLIFSLFTGMVALSTLMIGLVVRGASATIRRQGRQIEAAQRDLLQASKLAAVGELAAGVAHEINNPATTILSRATFLLSEDEVARSASDREDLEAIVAQAQRIAGITGGLLAFSRPRGLDLGPVSLDRVIDGGLRPIVPLLGAHDVWVERRIERGLPRAWADEGSLSRALENLFRNAVDAMPTGGALRIRAGHATAGRLLVEVSDTGTGIPVEHQARIFDAFFTTKELGKGTGLGLAIVHGIVEEHGGTISVESQPGRGTTFAVELPAEEGL